MDYQLILTEIATWPIEERIRLMREVCDGIAGQGDEPELTDEIKSELQRRLDAIDRDPSSALSWDEVKDSLKFRDRSANFV